MGLTVMLMSAGAWRIQGEHWRLWGTSVTPQSLLPKQTGLGAGTDRSFSLLCGIGSVDVPVHYSKDHVTQSAITKARRSDCLRQIRCEWPT